MFDKDDIEQFGLVKFDFGVEEFNDFGYGSKEINKLYPSKCLKLENLNEFNDSNTYDLLKSANTTSCVSVGVRGNEKIVKTTT